MRAGIEVLKKLEKPKFYLSLNSKAERFTDRLRAAVRDLGSVVRSPHREACVNAVGSLATLFFAREPIRNYQDAKKSDTHRFGAFFRAMLQQGILLAPSQFEALFISAAHTEEDLDVTLSAVSRWLYETRRGSAG